tara:strand:- start:1504 stop:2055 length:552 start_codon:yes stop_codon:yes gene_type:complete
MIETTLIKSCINNDRRMQNQLYKDYYVKMLSVCRRYTKDLDTAKELNQQAFIKIFTNLHMFNGGSLGGWIHRIVVNNALDSVRRKKVEFTPVTDDVINNAIADTTEYVEIGLNRADVLSAMNQLSPAYRNIFNMYIIQEMKHKEIAERLGISLGASKSNLHKAKRNIRKIMNYDYNSHLLSER